MKRTLGLAAAIALLFTANQSPGQSVAFDFQDGTDQGWGAGFGDDASQTFPIVDISGSLRMEILRDGGFQEAGIAAGNDGSDFYNTMSAAAANEAAFFISYDWYIDTSTWGANAGTFLQLGTFVNTGSGYYAQNFGASQVELSEAQVTSGQVFSGTVMINMATAGFDMPAADTFFRLGLIVNGDGSAQTAYFDNITVAVPEPATWSLLALAVPAAWLLRRRRAARS